jgi:hypothetical protein
MTKRGGKWLFKRADCPKRTFSYHPLRSHALSANTLVPANSLNPKPGEA